MPNLTYRIGAAGAALQQINARLDDGFSNFSARLDRNSEATAEGLKAITSAIAALDTRVAALKQRLEAIPHSGQGIR